MRKLLFIALFLVLLSGFVVSVQYGNSNGNHNSTDIRNNNSTEIRNNNTNNGIGQELSQLISERKAEIKSGNYTGPLGQLLNVRQLVNDLKELRVNNISAKTDLNITIEKDSGNQTRIRTRLRNGSEIEIKIMPDTAAQRALERLRIKVCSIANNCTIQLKDVGNGTNERAQYQVQLERHSRILGIFEKKMDVNAEVDAGNGEVIRVGKPWWSFLATQPAE